MFPRVVHIYVQVSLYLPVNSMSFLTTLGVYINYLRFHEHFVSCFAVGTSFNQ